MQTHFSIVREIQLAGKLGSGVDLHHVAIADDALISRSRSRACATFLESGQDVLFMLDHDIEFLPGDLLATARRAHRENAVVGGLYSCRAFGKGQSSRTGDTGDIEFVPGRDNLIEAECLATGFMAIPRKLLLRVQEQMLTSEDPDLRVQHCAADVANPYTDLFRCFTVPMDERRKISRQGTHEYLSEDYAWCIRVRAAGFKCFLYEKPTLTHWGKHGFTIRDSVSTR